MAAVCVSTVRFEVRPSSSAITSWAWMVAVPPALSTPVLMLHSTSTGWPLPTSCGALPRELYPTGRVPAVPRKIEYVLSKLPVPAINDWRRLKMFSASRIMGPCLSALDGARLHQHVADGDG